MVRCAKTTIGALAVAVVVVGVYARFAGLGSRPLADDEYYFVTSVHSILEEGLPRLPGGGYYFRGPLVQYVTAASVLLFDDNGFAYRFPMAVCGVVSCCIAYFYARRHLGHSLALTVSLMLLVSSWSIEFSRFARMYMPFQAITIAFAWASERAYYDGKAKLRYVPHVLIVVACLTHQLGMLLLPMLVVPLFRRTNLSDLKSKAIYLIASVMVGALCIVVFLCVRSDFGAMEEPSRYPAGYKAPASSPFRFPEYPFWRIAQGPATNLLFTLVLVGGSAAAMFWSKKNAETITDTYVLSIAALTSSLVHMLTVSWTCMMLLVIRCRARQKASRSSFVWLMAVAAIMLGLSWITLAFLDGSGLVCSSAGVGSRLGAIRRAFFGWPDYYSPVLLPWGRELPRLTVVILASCFVQVLLKGRDSWESLLTNPVTLLAYYTSVLGILNSPYASTRYTFCLYPIALCVVVLALRDLVFGVMRPWHNVPQHYCNVVTAGLAMLVFAVSGDFSCRHIAGINSQDVTYRLGAFSKHEPTWYPRRDYESPAMFANRFVEDATSARVVVFGESTVSHYLQVDHAIYFDRDDIRFYNVSRSDGTIDKWSGQTLLSTKEELQRHTENARIVLLIRRVPSGALDATAGVIESTFAGAKREFISRDTRLEVLIWRRPRERA